MKDITLQFLLHIVELAQKQRIFILEIQELAAFLGSEIVQLLVELATEPLVFIFQVCEHLYFLGARHLNLVRFGFRFGR